MAYVHKELPENIAQMGCVYAELFGYKYVTKMRHWESSKLDDGSVSYDTDKVKCLQVVVPTDRIDSTTIVLILPCHHDMPMQAFLYFSKCVAKHLIDRMTRDAHIHTMAHDDPDFLAVSMIEYAWVTSVYGKVADSTALHGILGHHVLVTSSKVSTWYHDVVPSRYVIGTLHFQNATLIEWFIKYQPTIEKSTYEGEFFGALRPCVECVIDPNVTRWYFNAPTHGIESLIDNSVHVDLYMKSTMSSFNLVDCEAA